MSSSMTSEVSNPLTDEEVKELDAFGELTAFTPLLPRAFELWEREILWGRVTPNSRVFNGLIKK